MNTQTNRSRWASRSHLAPQIALVGALALLGGGTAHAGGNFDIFTNPAPININDNVETLPYPSDISVSMSGVISDVNVTLNNFTHSFPNDVDVLLVSPNGQKVLLVSDAGSGTPVNNVSFTLDDEAATSVPTPITAGTYKPTNIDTDSDDFPAPAPLAPYASTLSSFDGVSPNGNWSLYVIDDAEGDLGEIQGGWSLDITTADPVQSGPTYRVNVTTDTNDGCTTADCSLREAINAANGDGKTSTINFAIGTGAQTINVGAAGLPVGTQRVTINGATQPGFGNMPLIRIDGAGVAATGLTVNGASSVVRSLIITGFATQGISLGGSTSIIRGCYIGTDGTSDLGNGIGISVLAGTGSVIGGSSALAGNVISGNDSVGISLAAASNTVEGNFIGTGALGVGAIGNITFGITVSGASNLIGTSTASNTIGANGSAGVNIEAGGTGSTVRNNFIGTNTSGSNLGNGGAGVRLEDVSGVLVGGTQANQSNTIAFNANDGIVVTTAATGNRLRNNLLFGNGDQPIDLGNDGATANDGDADGDAGANNLQNFPVITVSSSGSQTLVSGTLNGVPSRLYSVDVYRSATSGEARTLVLANAVTTNGSGSATFAFTVTGATGGQFFRAMATDQVTGDSSELSAAVTSVSDTTAPTLAVTSPTQNEPVTGSVTASGTSSDAGSGLSTVKYLLYRFATGSGGAAYYNFTPGTLAFETTATPTTAHQNTASTSNNFADFTAALPSLTDGKYNLTFNAYDKAGNASTVVRTFNKGTPDITKPTISISSPEQNTAYDEGTLSQVTGSATDSGLGLTLVRARLYTRPTGATPRTYYNFTTQQFDHTVFNAATDLNTYGTGANVTITQSLPALVVGSYSFEVTAIDGAGNYLILERKFSIKAATRQGKGSGKKA